MHDTGSGAAAKALTGNRVLALDHLRALAMLAGVLFHAGLAYSPMLHPLWPTAYRDTSHGVDAVAWLSHLIRMPLFFLIAGYVTEGLIRRHGEAGMARQRFRRIVVPFLIGVPLTHVAMSALTTWATTHVAEPSPFLIMARQWLSSPDTPTLVASTGHLWFLYYVILFTLLTWIGRSLEWGDALVWMRSLGVPKVALLLPVFILPGFLMTQAPHPAPESPFPQAWALVVYGPFFAFGYGYGHRATEWASLQRWRWPAVCVCVLLYGLYLTLLDRFDPADWTRTAPAAVAILESIVAAWGTLATLAFGLRWLGRPNAVLAYLSRSAYWIYLIHLPVLFAIQFHLHDRTLAWPLAFAASASGTLTIGLLTYEVLVRRTALRHWIG